MVAFAQGTYVGQSGPDFLVVRLDFETGRLRGDSVSGDIFRGLTAGDFNPALPDRSRFLGSFFSEAEPTLSSDAMSMQVAGRLLFRGQPQGVRAQLYSRRLSRTEDSQLEFRLQYDSAPNRPEEFIAKLAFWMKWFRAIEWEFDIVASQNNADNLSSALPRVSANYKRAHIGLYPTPGSTVIDQSDSSQWTEANLLDAMQRYFSKYEHHRTNPAWRVYTLCVPRFRGGDSSGRTTGIMFDRWDQYQRQAVAVFWRTRLESSQPQHFHRDLARTITHEIGHAFNLLHPFGTTIPAGGIRSASFMNYPHYYPGGTDSYWAAHEAQGGRFDSNELWHLRHNRLETVVTGWGPFGFQFGGGPEPADELDPATTCSPLELTIRLTPDCRHNLFEFGEPVQIEGRLATRSRDPQAVTDTLHPSLGETTYLVEQPSGKITRFRPFIVRDAEERRITLDDERPALYESVDLTHSADGFVFCEPGRYRLQAIHSDAGRPVTSNILVIYVRHPSRDVEAPVVKAWSDDNFGAHLSVWGHLERADDAVERVAALRKCKELQDSPHPLWVEAKRCALYTRLLPQYSVKPDNDGRCALNERGPTLQASDERLIENAFLALRRRDKEYLPEKARPLLPNLLYSHLAEKYAPFVDAPYREKLVEAVRTYHAQFNPKKIFPASATRNLRRRLGLSDGESE